MLEDVIRRPEPGGLWIDASANRVFATNADESAGRGTATSAPMESRAVLLAIIAGLSELWS